MLGMRSFRVSKPDPDTLVISTPRFCFVMPVIILLVVLVILLRHLLGWPPSLSTLAITLRDMQFYAWVSLFFGLIVFGSILYSLWFAIVGQEFVFDRVQGVLRKNGKRNLSSLRISSACRSGPMKVERMTWTRMD